MPIIGLAHLREGFGLALATKGEMQWSNLMVRRCGGFSWAQFQAANRSLVLCDFRRGLPAGPQS
jgi:hypothetical protein